jgi:hypothetical protein
VLRRDHHCNWIRNCVGVGNAFVFHCYVTTVNVSFVLWSYSSSVYLAAHSADVMQLAPASLLRRATALWLSALLRIRDPLRLLYTDAELREAVGIDAVGGAAGAVRAHHASGWLHPGYGTLVAHTWFLVVGVVFIVMMGWAAHVTFTAWLGGYRCVCALPCTVR